MSDFHFDKTYAFTLMSTMNQRLVGNVPGGTRLDLAYLNGGASAISVTQTGGLFPAGTTGTIITGQDWVLVGEDGVADFDGRFTAKVGDVVIGGHLQGRADLATLVVDGKPIQANAYETWYGGVGPNAEMPIILPIVFEIPSPNEDSAEAQGTASAGASSAPDPSGSEAARVRDGLTKLSRCLAVGEGKVTFKPNQSQSPVNVITLDVFCLAPAWEKS